MPDTKSKKQPPTKPKGKPLGKPGEPTVVAEVNTKYQLCAARFSPCGKYLAAGGMEGQVLRWDASAADDAFPELPALAGHGGWIGALEFARTGNRLYTGDSWGRLSAWDYAAQATKPLWTIDAAHAGWLRSVAVSPNGRTLATCGADKVVRLWEAVTGKKLAELSGHSDDTFCVAFAPDGATLVSGDLLGVVKLWDVKAGKLRQDVDAKKLSIVDRLQTVGGVRLLMFTPDGKQLLVGGTKPKNGGNVQGNATLLVFDAATGKETKKLELSTSHVYIHDLQFLPGGDWAIVLSGNPGSGKFALHKAGEEKPYFETTKLSNCHGVTVHPAGKCVVVMAMNPNSSGNGRVKNKDGSTEYPGNWSPLHIIELTS